MLQAFETSLHPAMAFAIPPRPSVVAISDSDGASLGRRLPRFEKTARMPHGPATPGVSFLDHLKGLAVHETGRR